MCSHETDAADSLLVPLHVGDRLPWKLDRHGQRGMVTTCESACHALLPVRRIADRADLRHLLGRGRVMSPHPGRPDSRSPTAMSFAVVSSLYPHPSTVLEESIMTATYTFDVFSSLDGLGSHSGDWAGRRPPLGFQHPSQPFDGIRILVEGRAASTRAARRIQSSEIYCR